jgi:hypothetical protein
MWKEWLHSPSTVQYQQDVLNASHVFNVRNGHSSPGNLHLEQVLS